MTRVELDFFAFEVEVRPVLGDVYHEAFEVEVTLAGVVVYQNRFEEESPDGYLVDRDEAGRLAMVAVAERLAQLLQPATEPAPAPQPARVTRHYGDPH